MTDFFAMTLCLTAIYAALTLGYGIHEMQSSKSIQKSSKDAARLLRWTIIITYGAACLLLVFT